MDVEYKDLEDQYFEKDYDSIEVYSYTIKTVAGYIDIIFRNESNGYYNGWCELINENIVPYDYHTSTPVVWRNITEDFEGGG